LWDCPCYSKTSPLDHELFFCQSKLREGTDDFLPGKDWCKYLENLHHLKMTGDGLAFVKLKYDLEIYIGLDTCTVYMSRCFSM